MAYREVGMLESIEVLRLWLKGTAKKRIARQLGLDPKTVRRYVRVKPKIFGPLTLLRFSVVESFFLQSSIVRIAPGSCRPMNRVA